MLFVCAACADSKTPLAADELPNEIKTYLKTYFPSPKIIQAMKERDDLRTSYEVMLDNHITLTFNRKGAIKEIESKVNAALPDAVIPATILTYVKERFPDAFIIEWELDDRGQKVKLSNRYELEFDMQGKFLRIDD
jgi:hypothetical protein